MILPLLRAVPFALWCGVTWRLSAESDPSTAFPLPFHVPDKLAHFAEYAVGGVLAVLALSSVPRWPRRFPALVAAVVLCTLWGVLDEIHQRFVPGRSADPADVAADALGAAAGAGATHLVLRRRTAERTARGSR